MVANQPARVVTEMNNGAVTAASAPLAAFGVVPHARLGEPELPALGPRRRAAQYVRMSTDLQQHSIAFQVAAIAEYAALFGHEVVRTYADEGVSGLTADRPGLTALLDDIGNGRADFSTVLVYDISRWGRFQDTDESAYYEFACRRAGITVEYCAEPLCNSDAPIASVIKTLKRVMAGEYSRELSAKVAASKRRMAQMGYCMGSRAAYGFRRLLVDARGTPRMVLEAGERKYLQSDHVKLCLGPERELRTVRWMYRQVAEHGSGFAHLARTLNARKSLAPGGRPWSEDAVARVLRNEQYLGVFAYGVTTTRLKGPQVATPRESWITIDQPQLKVISRDLFDRAQAVIASDSHKLSDEEGLELLKDLLKRRGRLSTHIIGRARGLPTAQWYRTRFGSLRAAYARIGYEVPRDQAHFEGFGERITLARKLRDQATNRLRALGATVDREGARTLVVGGRLRVIPVVGRYVPVRGLMRCTVKMTEKPDWVLIQTVEARTNTTVAYHLAPGGRCLYQFGSPKAPHPERVASPTLEPLLELLARPGGPEAVG